MSWKTAWANDAAQTQRHWQEIVEKQAEEKSNKEDSKSDKEEGTGSGETGSGDNYGGGSSVEGW